MGPESSKAVSQMIAAWNGFGWPHVALFMSLIFLIMFRKKIGALIDRLSKLSPSGAEFGNSPVPEDLQAPISKKDPARVVEQNKDSIESETASVQAQGIPLPPYSVANSMAVAREFVENEISTVDQADQHEYLVSRLSFMRVLWNFEYIYSMIFGGQIALLKHLNHRIINGVAKAEVETLWAEHQAKWAPQMNHWQLDQYINFLVVQGLILTDGESFAITAKGRELLVWMLQSSKTEDKLW
ncbi:winged helix-turn-helix domain-containing protein [Pseudomonas shirazensis]